MNETDFLRHYLQNASQIMWFLGAGSSRSAGMPTATDIIWDLKIKYYCEQERQDIKSHDTHNDQVKARVQSFLNTKDFPQMWSVEEYSFYFELLFGRDYSAQSKYLAAQLSNEKISLNIGHKVLAALLDLGKCKAIYSTNFDEVIEQAYAHVTNKSLSTYHLEGTYAALDALNNEQFPFYAKIHGDFKYQSLKNLAEDLINNDNQIQKCFIASCSRYGLVVSGYSGRDHNVMSMFRESFKQPNAYPFGLFWTVIDKSNITEAIRTLIDEAKQAGINAHIVETGTFDTIMARIWKQLPNIPESIQQKVNISKSKTAKISLPDPGKSYPIIRLNALPITELPSTCAKVTVKRNITYQDLKQLMIDNNPDASLTKADDIIGWGAEEEIVRGLGQDLIEKIETHNLDNLRNKIIDNTFYRSFFESVVVRSICRSKPIRIKRRHKRFYAFVDQRKKNDSAFEKLKFAVSTTAYPQGYICGNILGETSWSEAVELKLEIRGQNIWLVLRPTIWIDPADERRHQIDFIKKKISRRYNGQSSKILDAWIDLLLPSSEKGKDIAIECYAGSKFPLQFKINNRTSYSRK